MKKELKSYIKHLLLTFMIATCALTIKAQTPNWLWANKGGTGGDQHGYGICSDTSGNIYVTGSFTTDTMRFGSINLVNKSPNSSSDIFLVKYNAAGNALWARNPGGTENETASAIALDTAGNILLTGSYSSSTFSFGSSSLSAIGENDILILKYDASGNELWARTAGGTLSEGGNSISADPSGNIFVTGDFRSPSIMCDTTKLLNASTNNFTDPFILKYNPSGKLLWAKRAGGTTVDHGYGITTDGQGNALLTGSFGNISITFGSKTLTNKGAGSSDAFVVKYDPSGNVIWAKNPGGPSYDESQAICTDKNGNFYITGFFQPSTMAFDAITLTNSGGLDVFVAKYDSSGKALWARNASGSSSEIGYGITVDNNGNVYTTGIFYSPTAVFGSFNLTNSTPGGAYDIYVVKYDASGKALWAKSAGGTDYDDGRGICTDGYDNAYITGSYVSKTMNLGTLTLKGTGSSVRSDMLVAKLGQGCYKPYLPITTVDSNNCLKYHFKNLNPEMNYFKWHFGDGNTSIARHPVHSYSVKGKYTIRLIAGIDSSCTDSVSFPIIPYCKFCGIKDSLVLSSDTSKPYEATLDNYSTGTIHKHFWNFGDGNTSNQSSPVHTYTIGGPIRVMYIATDTITKCIDTTFINFTIDSTGRLKRGAFTLNIKYHHTPGLQIFKNESSYKLYPNPFSTNITITGNVSDDINGILLFNTFGQQIPVTCQKDNIQWIITPSDVLTKGIYYMQLCTSKGNEWVKVMKE